MKFLPSLNTYYASYELKKKQLQYILAFKETKVLKDLMILSESKSIILWSLKICFQWYVKEILRLPYIFRFLRLQAGYGKNIKI